jgi:adenylate cyclase
VNGGLPFLLSPLVVGGLITLGACAIGVSTPGWLQFLHYRVFDTLAAPAADVRVSDLLVIVDIDERSLKVHGRWPWPRRKLAELVNRMQAMEPLAFGLDMMFPEPEVPDSTVGLVRSAVDTREGMSRDDRLLAVALSASGAVLGFQFQFEEPCEAGACLEQPLPIIFESKSGAATDLPLIRACGAVCSLPGLSGAAHASGFFNVSPDSDGTVRTVPLLMECNGRVYPSLALAVWMKAVHPGSLAIHRDAGAAWLRAGTDRIPLEGGGRLRVGFRGKGRTFPYVSADDILAGRLPPERLRGKIAFVGTSAAGLKESRSTPADPLFPGVEVHATIVDNLLSAAVTVRPWYAQAVELAAAVLTGFVAVAVIRRGRAMTTLIVLAIGAALLWGATAWAFAAARVLLSPALPLLVLVANFSGLSLLRFWAEERSARERSRELALAQEAIIESMASLTETRDPETGGHIKRTQNYVRILARALRARQGSGKDLPDDAIDLLYKSAPLHDIGKVGVPDHILLKPGKLTADEFDIMKRHTVYGRDAIRAAMRKLANGSFLQTACDIAISHHERWDGSGYPGGLRGEDIPLAGRLMALADTYDALISRRVYKPPMCHESAARIILESAGSQFDPRIVEAFRDVAGEFRKVAAEHADEEADFEPAELPIPAVGAVEKDGKVAASGRGSGLRGPAVSARHAPTTG